MSTIGCGEEPIRKDAPNMWQLINKARGYPGASYELTRTTEDQTQKWRMWAKGTLMRAEGPYKGRDAVMIISTAARQCEIMYKDDNSYDRSLNDNTFDWRYNPYDVLQYIDPNLCKVEREEKVDNVLCLVIVIDYPNGKITIWQREDIGLPARLEISNSNQDQVIEFRDYGLSNYSYELFTLPGRYDRYMWTNPSF